MQLAMNDLGENEEADIEPEHRCSSTAIDPVDLSSLRFTPGKGRDESITEMTHQISVNLRVQHMKAIAPVPQICKDLLKCSKLVYYCLMHPDSIDVFHSTVCH
jgi:hypothetical protein